MVLKLDAV